MRKRTSTTRSQSGISIILASVCAVLIALLLYLAFHFGILMSGSREVRNAVDASVLNVSRRVNEIRVEPQGVYGDCADTSGTIGMSNINRVWGKAYLINANVESMKKEGLSNPETEQNAGFAYQEAQQTNDDLYSRLVSKGTLDAYFNQFAANKPAKLLGGTAKTNNNINWSFASIDRGQESNISVNPSQLPTGSTVESIQKGNSSYIRGYTPFTANSRQFTFASFRKGEMPHLISDNSFAINKGTVGGGTIIPNAFQVTGVVDSSKASLSAVASAAANPRLQYELAIPHAYVTISFKNIAYWYVNGKQVNTTEYECKPEEKWGVKNYKMPSGSLMNGYASLGNEYNVPSIWKAINSLPGDHTIGLNKLVQRVREIKPDFSLGQLQQLLEKLPVDQTSKKYYIYPVYSSKDNTNPDMMAGTDTGGLPGWINPQTTADGTLQNIGKEEKQTDEPNINWQNLPGEHHTEVSGKIDWIPGSGYTKCLGTLKLTRFTDSYHSSNK